LLTLSKSTGRVGVVCSGSCYAGEAGVGGDFEAGDAGLIADVSCVLAVENELRHWGTAFAFVSSELSGDDQGVKILILVLHFLHLTTTHFPTPKYRNAGKVSLISLLLPSPPHQQRQLW